MAGTDGWLPRVSFERGVPNESEVLDALLVAFVMTGISTWDIRGVAILLPGTLELFMDAVAFPELDVFWRAFAWALVSTCRVNRECIDDCCEESEASELFSSAWSLIFKCSGEEVRRFWRLEVGSLEIQFNRDKNITFCLCHSKASLCIPVIRKQLN